MEIDENEFLRGLECRAGADEELTRRMDEAAKRCLAIAEPRCVAVRLTLNEDFSLGETGFIPAGQDIRRHLLGCGEVYLMALTLGIGAERELMRLSAKSAGDALLFDTAASCAAESYADDVCADLELSCGRRLTTRFSCGYGDFPLESQREICRILRTDVRIGLCCDENFLLTPRKSITALAGITQEPAGTKRTECGHKCAACKNAGCTFRKGV